MGSAPGLASQEDSQRAPLHQGQPRRIVAIRPPIQGQRPQVQLKPGAQLRRGLRDDGGSLVLAGIPSDGEADDPEFFVHHDGRQAGLSIIRMADEASREVLHIWLISNARSTAAGTEGRLALAGTRLFGMSGRVRHAPGRICAQAVLAAGERAPRDAGARAFFLTPGGWHTSVISPKRSSRRPGSRRGYSFASQASIGVAGRRIVWLNHPAIPSFPNTS